MTRPLPSLNGLRAFEAAARHLSVKSAAEELNVTPGAVSQQLKRLEAELGIALFARRGNEIALTDAGARYAASVRVAFARLVEATALVQPRQGRRSITISTLPSFAIKWLVPRLGRFQASHPDIDVRISASSQLVDFARDQVDGAIRHGLGRYAGLKCWFLLPEELFPVCSPVLIERGPHPLRTPADLKHHVLLHDSNSREWSMWLEAAGIAGIDAERGPSFSDNGLLLQAAITGQGVAISRGALVAEDLAEGRLVVPFNIVLPSELAYYFVCPEDSAGEPKLARFREWLLEEAAAMRPAAKRG
jgi:LysR family glycine cleavage system transcriptional activator